MIRTILISPVVNPEALRLVWELRYDVLRKPLGMPFSSASFDGDALETTIHVIAVSEDFEAGLIRKDSMAAATNVDATVNSRSNPETSRPETSDYGTARTGFPSTLGLAGCVTLLTDPHKPSIQLRGMAVRQDYQGLGIGAKLLGVSYEIAKKHGKTLWCNARLSAVSFYERNGWTSYGPFFEILIIGQHVAMQWKDPNHEQQRS